MPEPHPVPDSNSPRARARFAPPSWWPTVLVASWLLALFAAMLLLERYKNTPGPVGAVRTTWPVTARLAHATDQPTLLLFVHPRCTCTRATLAELDTFLPRYAGRVHACAVFWAPSDLPATWTHTDTWRTASAMPGLAVRLDPDGREAARFGVLTSGHALLYAADGRLLFSGGITPSRGHMGDSAGLEQLRRALAAALHDGPARPAAALGRAPVFGCGLDARTGTRAGIVP